MRFLMSFLPSRSKSLLLPLLLLLSPSFVTAQKEINLKPQVIINQFIQKIGGERWLTLETRKEYSFITHEESKRAVVPTKDYNRTIINLKKREYAELHEFFTGKTSLFVNQSNCIWRYSTSSQFVHFFDPEPIKLDKKFLRIEVLDVLNLKPMKKAFVEDTLYRVDFNDSRQADGKQSLYFGIASGLLYKRAYNSKRGVRWEYQFSNYQESEGFVEPYQIVLTGNDEGFYEIQIDSIEYNIEVDRSIFYPPVPCQDHSGYERLALPFDPRID